VEKTGLKKPRSLEDLASPNREVCHLLSSLGVVFNIAKLIKLEYNPKHLKGYIGMLSCFCFYLLAHYVGLLSYALLFSCAGMMLNTEKRRMLAEAASKLKVGVGPSDANMQPLLMLLLRLFLPQTLLLLPLRTLGRRRWLRLLPLKTRKHALASSSRGKGALMSWF